MSTYVELASEGAGEGPTEGPTEGGAPSAWDRVRSLRKRKTLAASYGIAIVATVTLVYLCSLVGFLPADPNAMDLSAMNQPPSADHFLGTDFVGRDLLHPRRSRFGRAHCVDDSAGSRSRSVLNSTRVHSSTRWVNTTSWCCSQ